MSLQHRLLGTGVGEAGIVDLHDAALDDAAARTSAGGRTLGSVSSTSVMRSADTSARGNSMNMNVAIITDIRIWMR